MSEDAPENKQNEILVEDLIRSLPKAEALELIRRGYASSKSPFYRSKADSKASIEMVYLSVISYETIVPFDIPEGFGPKKKN